MPKTRVIGVRLTEREEWLLSHLPPDYPGQPFSDRLRNLLIDAAYRELNPAQVRVDVTANSGRAIVIIDPGKLGLKKGEEPIPKEWPKGR